MPRRRPSRRQIAALTGRWQLVSNVVDGVPVPTAIAGKMVLIADHDIFCFPADAGLGNAAQGKFTINPTTSPEQVNSPSEAGPREVMRAVRLQWRNGRESKCITG